MQYLRSKTLIYLSVNIDHVYCTLEKVDFGNFWEKNVIPDFWTKKGYRNIFFTEESYCDFKVTFFNIALD